MKKRLIALFLCVALLSGLFTTLVYADPDGEVRIYSGGQPVSEVAVPVNGRASVQAVLPGGVSQGIGQWEIYVSGIGTWAAIHGATGTELNLSAALLANAMDSDTYSTKLRYSFTGLSSAEITAYLSFDESDIATLEETPAAVEPIKPIIIDEGSVVVHTLIEPAAETDKAADEADNTDKTEGEDSDTDKTGNESGTDTTVNPEAGETGAAGTEGEIASTPAPTTTPDPAATAAPTTTPDPVATAAPETDVTGTSALKAWGESLLVFLGNETEAPAAGEPAPLAETDPELKTKYTIEVKYQFGNGDTAYDSYAAELAEGSVFSATVTFPKIMGYLPYVNDVQQDSIYLDYASVNQNVTITVVYKPTNVDYTVIHYQQNVDNDNYTALLTETKQELTGNQVPEVANEYTGFYNLLYERPNVAADGSTVIEIYYDRYYYLLNFDMDGGYGTDPIYARYGAAIGTVPSPTKAGYTFEGWSATKDGTTAVTLPTVMPAASMVYYAIWVPDATAKVTLVFWGENPDDEGYSYLSDYTKTINLKPGREFTYSEGEMSVCDREEHTHTDACVGCGMAEHTHSAVGGSCYTMSCGTEAHAHSTSCYAGVDDVASTGSIAKPSNPSEGEVYEGRFGTYIYIKGRWYDYSGSTASGSIAPTTCGKSEHSHNNACYTLTCDKAHTHTPSCYICGKEAHTHNPDCYMNGAGMDNKLWKFVKSDTVTVAADGSSVVNVYYDRTQFTLHFRNANSDTDNHGTITEKWGANIRTKFEAKNTSAGTALWSRNRNGSGPWTAFLDKMPEENRTYYAYLDGAEDTHTAVYYGEPLSGTELVTLYTSTAKYTGTLNVTTEDKVAIEGFTYKDSLRFNNRTYNSTANQQPFNGAKFYYQRNTFKIEYNNYVGAPKTESAKYGASIDNSTFNWTPGAELAPDIYEPGSVTFAGWYLNPQCSGEPYSFTGKTMPVGPSNTDGEVALVLYAKWEPVKHTVTFKLTESSEEVYFPSKADTAAQFEVPHGDNIAEEYVTNHLEKSAMNEAKPNGDYTFVMWYYYENGVKKPFDPTTQIRKDLTLFGEWSSNTLKQYTVQYVLQSDHTVKVADDLTGSGLAGTTKTFDAKGDTDLYADYREGYFPTAQSQSLLLDIDSNSLVLTFEYVPAPAVQYTVKYVDKDTGASLAPDKVVADNRKAVVTENFVPVSGYMPDAYQKRLVVTVGGTNILYFYYTKDNEHAYYKVSHFIQNDALTGWTEYTSSQIVGDIGTRYTASPMTIPGFTYNKTEYMVNGTEVTDVTAQGAVLTENGLEINLYYVRNDYPYIVRYLEQGTGNILHDPKSGTGKYGQIVSESAIDIDGYDKIAPTSVALNIRIDEGTGAPNINIITFYYKEKEVPITYVAVGPTGAVGFGSVSPTAETVKIKSGTAQGSTPTAGDGYKFVGWYKDAACTVPVDTSWVTDNKITPQKVDGKHVSATYYAKFEYDVADLTIVKSGANETLDPNQTFIFTVTGSSGYSTTVAIKGNGSVTLKGLKIDTYTVHEVGGWSWRYSCSDQSITLLPGVSNIVTMTNSRGNNKWLDGNSYSENVFTR